MTENEIKNKLTKLGFYNNLTINEEINESNDTIISKDKSLLEQLETLTQMFQDGLITKEEFKKAKKKILN
ncbi:SHOCT domain-containing protein [Pelagibacterales bacterium SAG-MED50]|nr:SHOCT domain-containing protein [Pelagibacterales bacterium SAG-MED50]